ncbi:response regulator [Desulfococcaceae bacterium HSG8]|nr:response regulator [Desulfococcaceae bacterium HSG8]
MAEDNIPNQKVALAILRKYGFSADIANNGKEAVEALRKMRYDLVLMDMQMPETDGVEATRIIRNPGSGVTDPDIPIVAMTANAAAEDRKKCEDAGMNGYISKPVDPGDLLTAIGRFLPVTMIPKTRKSTPGTVISQVFDFQELSDRIGGDEEFLKDYIIKEIPNTVPLAIEKIKAAAYEKNPEKIRLHAHSLKGMFANAAAHRLSEAAHRIERIGKQGGTDIVHSLEKLEQEHETFREVLSDMFPDIFSPDPRCGEISVTHSAEPLTEEAKARLPELLRRLEDEMIPRQNEIGEVFYIDEVTEFATDLKHMAYEYQSDILGGYSQKLYEAATGSDIDKTENLLWEFPVVADKIKELSRF